jgi:hypothetical protein
MSTTVDEAALAAHHRRVHRALLEAVLQTGRVPSASVLADQLGATAEAIRASLRVLAAADYLGLDVGGRVTCLYPFSVTPTPQTVLVEGAPRFAMCAIDALGIPAMLDRELDIEGRCAVCDAAIMLRVRPGAIVATTPLTAMVVARRDEAEPAFAACCPYTVFVCGQEHAEQFTHRVSGTQALSLAEAWRRAEEIFGSLLADTIPASRPRGKRWGQARDA